MSIDAIQSSMSMSGGGVGGSTGPSPIFTPATSPVNAVPLSSCR
jgi:hypothetical protein